MHDYSDYIGPTSDDALARLSQLAEAQLEAQISVAKAERGLKAWQEELRQISEVHIPELMEELGVEEITTTSGIKLAVSEKIQASILAANKAAAFRWLRENGHEALIKRVVRVQFGMGEDELAQEAIDRLKDLPVEDDSKVHPSTLKKFVKELLSEGQEVPEELFSVHRQRVANIKV